MRYTFPPDYSERTCYLVPINVTLIPMVAGALRFFEKRGSWETEQDYEQGYTAFAELQVCLMKACIDDLVESNNRLYRLLDTALYGRVYQLVTTEPLTITPEIPPVPDPFSTAPGMVPAVDGLAGVLDPGWFGFGGSRATLADIVRALRVGKESTATDVWQKVKGILDAGGDAAQVGELVEETFTDGVNAVEEGGIFVTLLAMLAANAAAAQAQIIQTQRLIHSLDGGSLIPPSDNILTALRGTTPAGELRNVIDASGGAAAIEKLDAMIAELQAIRSELV